MINKALVKKRFQKSLSTYNDNALIQKYMADKLISLLPDKNYNKIFEIGCSSGVLTVKIKEQIKFQKFTANDIVPDSKQYIDKIMSKYSFIQGDIEEINLEENYDLIISNACLQWCSDIEKVMLKLLNNINPNGILAISIFGEKNLKEIKNIFQLENKTYNLDKLNEFLNQFNTICFKEEEKKLTFETPLEILRHLKLTGANAIKEIVLTKSKLHVFENKYIQLYSDSSKKVSLTYNPVYIVIKKNDIEQPEQYV